jgi:hypothetical protein
MFAHVPLQHAAFAVQIVPGGAQASHAPAVQDRLQHSTGLAQPAAPARQASQVPSSWQWPVQHSPSAAQLVPPAAQHSAPAWRPSKTKRPHSSPAQHGTSA